MTVYTEAFDYIEPTDEQLIHMTNLREAAKQYAAALEFYLPNGADKTYTLRKLREVAMWANVALTRYDSGLPR